MAWWRMQFGDAFSEIQPFLVKVIGECVGGYSCQQTGVRLKVRKKNSGGYLAFASGEYAEDFDDIELKWPDVQAWRFDLGKLQTKLCQILEIEHASSTNQGAFFLLGRCKRCPDSGQVYSHLGDSNLDSISKIVALGKKSNIGCVILGASDPILEPILESIGVASIILPKTGAFDGNNSYRCGDLCRRVRRDLTGHEIVELTGKRFDKIEQGVSNMGKYAIELESENKQLKESLANQLAALGKQVDPVFLNWILVILACGSVNAAADMLKISNSTFNDKIQKYVRRGGVYSTLYSLIAIRRKGMGQKKIERYNEMFDEHQAEQSGTDPAIWRDLLDGLEAMNPTNVRTIRDELIELVKEQLPET